MKSMKINTKVPTCKSPTKFSKYSAEVLDVLGFDAVEALNAHYKDLDKRLISENSAMKPRKSLITALMTEQATTLKCLLQYSTVKPSSTVEPTDTATRRPLAITLDLG